MGSAPPFAALSAALPSRTPLREAITAARRRPEPQCLPALMPLASLEADEQAEAAALARRLAEGLRSGPTAIARESMVQGLLQEFSLSSEEGVALMCLAEALLRIPDAATRDALIRDKIGRADWRSHVGRSSSPFVNAAAWGLLVSGQLVATHDETGLAASLTRLTARFGEPVIRKAVDIGMRLMGRQFVAGETIAEALENARRYEAKGFRYSYDMLGEAALTAEDAARYLGAYERAIDAIGVAAAGRGIYEGPGLSIKLSALHPRYVFSQHARIMAELYPRLRDLVLRARRFDVGINIDAEESDRLEPSLDLLEALCQEPALAGWNGIGFVAQAYQKRCPAVIDFLVDLARRTQRRLMVRLVKGAYWDSEIKRAQVEGLDGYPVYTRKVYTDVSYLACARKLLAAPAAIYPQFATHNAQTLASIFSMAGPWKPGQYEFQCLHGMGEPLYAQVVGAANLDRPCRIYAPVGTHETLLAYLVRRLLENGANTSFINRIADPRVSLEDLVESPQHGARRIESQEGTLGLPHPRIPLPRDLFGPMRRNPHGADLTDESVLKSLLHLLPERRAWRAAPSFERTPGGEGVAVRNPARHSDIVGRVVEASLSQMNAALAVAEEGAATWRSHTPAQRGNCLVRAADLLEAEMPQLLGLIVRESGKTLPNAVAEVREAVDFLRFYGLQGARLSADLHVPLGLVACISPWNFPLAIFAGQVGAALAAGNAVVAKPAEQTPLIAAQAVRILHAAGVPSSALVLLPGAGHTVGAALVGDARVQGVAFTGSTEVARAIQRALAQRLDARGKPVTLVAETGGQNAMIVDTSALTEQVVQDALLSAFDSAGQRCSALRVLCVQEEAADRLLAMLRGAMQELVMGSPESIEVDVGPVIDAQARDALLDHIEKMRSAGAAVVQASRGIASPEGTFVPPTVIEIASLEQLTREVFGPVLHVLRYRREELDTLLERINALGFGLTLGIHSRVDGQIEAIVQRARAGNVYVNRNIVGAVVGVQPFGGEGLSGTGPKAGGPLYVYRFLCASPPSTAVDELRRLDALEAALPAEPRVRRQAFTGLRAWAGRDSALEALCSHLAELSPLGDAVVLPGPTGERNTYRVLPRERVLCLADQEGDRLAQLALVLALGGRAVWPASAGTLRAKLPEAVRDSIIEVRDWTLPEARIEAVLHHGSRGQLLEVLRRVADRPGPILLVHSFEPGEAPLAIDRLLVERVVSVNTAAAGGNASLMTVG